VTDANLTAPHSAPKTTLFLLAGLTALGEFAVTAYIPAITIIADGLGTRTEIVQTTVSVGLVTGAIAGLVIGAVADSIGRRQLLFPALGLYIVVASSLLRRRRSPGYLLVVYCRPLAPARE
jgi:MFS transporter, DHA1 family, multidrug resistance protein